MSRLQSHVQPARLKIIREASSQIRTVKSQDVHGKKAHSIQDFESLHHILDSLNNSHSAPDSPHL
jgi:hypothetical protein